MSRKTKLLRPERFDKERTDKIIAQGFDPRPHGPVFVRRAKNAAKAHELETGSVRSRARGIGSHKGKPIFGHDGPAKRDRIAAEIGKKTKAKKRKKIT